MLWLSDSLLHNLLPVYLLSIYQRKTRRNLVGCFSPKFLEGFQASRTIQILAEAQNLIPSFGNISGRVNFVEKILTRWIFFYFVSRERISPEISRYSMKPITKYKKPIFHLNQTQDVFYIYFILLEKFSLDSYRD